MSIKEQKDSLVNILNMRKNQSFNNANHNLDIDDSTKRQNYPLLSTLNVPFTSYTMSILLYEIIKLSKEFPNSSISKIKYPQGSRSKLTNIPK